jgi:deoxyribose-phosphate aldolase
MNLAQRARQAVGLLDLTSLNANDDEARIQSLCRRARTPLGDVAAVCVWPRFIATAQHNLKDSKIRIAAVANFPAGASDVSGAVLDARAIVSAGAHEVDVVFPYNAWLNGDCDVGKRLVGECKAVCREKALLKVILETGCLWRSETIHDVAIAAIDAGADFIKTSTGKTAISATPQAAREMLGAISARGARCGLKISGGIRDAAAAANYLNIAATTMGESWISPATFRFGASGVLDNLIAVASGGGGPGSTEAY